MFFVGLGLGLGLGRGGGGNFQAFKPLRKTHMYTHTKFLSTRDGGKILPIIIRGKYKATSRSEEFVQIKKNT